MIKSITLSLALFLAACVTAQAATIDVDTGKRQLTLVQDDGIIRTYPIGVARAGFEWHATLYVSRKAEWPAWTPPAEMRLRRPDLPAHMAGGIDNPLGARALYLGNTLYRIHGSNEPESIGQAVSSGCIRMLNDHIIELYELVPVGTKVVIH